MSFGTGSRSYKHLAPPEQETIYHGVQTEEQTNSFRDLAYIKSFLARVNDAFSAKPFKPHTVFTGGHQQTLAAHVWPRSYRYNPAPTDEERFFEVEHRVTVLAQCRWQNERENHATIVIWHGMEGSISSVYMLATAEKAFSAGFNVVRVNFRNCGGTEHLTPTLYHGGLSEDLLLVTNELIKSDGLRRLFLLGFSLGGNMILKLAGERGDNLPAEVAAIAAVSPSVDLAASSEQIHLKRNWIYHRAFLQSLKKRIQLKKTLYPDIYDLARLPSIRTVREFDEEFVARASGFVDADDYYHRASSIRVALGIRVPALIIHAEDDPFIPFEPLRDPVFSDNPYILLIATPRGGHVAFISSGKFGEKPAEDRFWAENRAVEFFQLANEALNS